MNDEGRLLALAERVVGPCRVVADLSWPHGESVVLDVEGDDGRRVIAKSYLQAAKYEAERTALERWAPAVGDERAPRLLATDAEVNALVMTRLRARPVDSVADVNLRDVHRQAGELLARFHQAEPAVVLEGYAESQWARFETWVARARDGVLDDGEVAFAARQVGLLDELPAPVGVPCHRDWQPRNWLIDGAGAVAMIDFGLARVGPWYEDLHRPWWREWAESPDLAEAFFAGYGRRPEGDDLAALLATSVLGHVTVIVWADEHGDEAFGAHGRACLAQARTGLDDLRGVGRDA